MIYFKQLSSTPFAHSNFKKNKCISIICRGEDSLFIVQKFIEEREGEKKAIEDALLVLEL